MAFSSQAGLQSLKAGRAVASYNRHPPIFRAVLRTYSQRDANTPVASLARVLAITEPYDREARDAARRDHLDQLLRVGKYREPDYNPWAVEPEDIWGAPEGYNE